MPKAKNGMTEKQKRFADEYLIDLNGTQAAIRAGYSAKTAFSIQNQLLKNPLIREYVDKRMEEKNKKLIASQDEVLQYLTKVLRGESQAEIVVVVNKGDFVSEPEKVQKAPDEKERLKAAELIGKRYGLYTDRQEITGAVPVVIAGEDALED